MHTFRQHAACLGVSGDFSIMRNVFGFSRGTLPPDPTGAIVSVSMREQIAAIEGRHIHVNVIRVGFDAIASAAIAAAIERVDFAILRIRQIYAPAQLGVGRVLHWEITQTQAGGADDIGSEDEADELWSSWDVPNNGVDVFITRTMSTTDFIGLSPVDGACDKDGKDDGLFGGRIDRAADGVARTFAHEIGHYLGLEHNHGDNCPASVSARNRLMAQTRCAVSARTSTNLTSGEASTMRDHCIVRSGC
jgi:hypothetical protein